MLGRHAAEVAVMRANMERRDDSIASLTSERDDLLRSIAAEYLDAPSAALVALVQAEALSDSESRMRSAYFMRDRAMAAVWRIHELHDVEAGEKCSCGKTARACKELAALEFFRRDFYDWEKRNLSRMKEGLSHGLPLDHPEAKKHGPSRDWWKGMPTTKLETQRGRTA